MENIENNSTEQDPTRSMRESLIQMLPANSEMDNVLVEKFRSGVFFVPSETVAHVSALIDTISDERQKKEAYKLMAEILDIA